MDICSRSALNHLKSAASVDHQVRQQTTGQLRLYRLQCHQQSSDLLSKVCMRPNAGTIPTNLNQHTAPRDPQYTYTPVPSPYILHAFQTQNNTFLPPTNSPFLFTFKHFSPLFCGFRLFSCSERARISKHSSAADATQSPSRQPAAQQGREF